MPTHSFSPAPYRESFHSKLLESMAVGYALQEAILDEQGRPRDFRYLEVNAAFEQILGLPREQALGRTVLEVFPKTEQHWMNIFSRVAMGGAPERAEHFGISLGRYFEVTASSPEPGLVAVMFADITARKKAEKKVKQAMTVFNNTMEAILIADSNHNIIEVNPAYTGITGYTRDEVLGRHYRFHQSGLHDESFYRELWHSLKEYGHWQGEIRNRRKSGEIYPAWENISVVRDATGKITNYIAVIADISKLKEAEAQLSHLAHHDSLTGLFNRFVFTSGLEQALERAGRHQQKVALLFLDLDRFKLINDTLGHGVGDELLCTIAQRLKEAVRSEDLIARLGGDEFTIILEEISHPEDVASLARKLIDTISAPMRLHEHHVVTSTSIGISIFPDDADNASELARLADSAMYRAKLRGRNTFEFYTSKLTDDARDRLSLECHLRRALEFDELLLYYQPQLDLTTGKLCGMEALLRWQHPKLGLLSPDQFIRIAEESGLIDSIGDWVIKRVCEQAATWRDAYHSKLRIAVNVSTRELMYNHTLDAIQRSMRERGLGVDDVHFELEITEGVLQSGDEVITALKELSALGVGVAIDDFGTGYSSLNRLKDLPVDILKLDRTFMAGLPGDAGNRAITRAVIALGHGLGLRVIAEGVENRKQLRFLRECGCDEAQGFLFSRPLPAAKAARYLAQ